MKAECVRSSILHDSLGQFRQDNFRAHQTTVTFKINQFWQYTRAGANAHTITFLRRESSGYNLKYMTDCTDTIPLRLKKR